MAVDSDRNIKVLREEADACSSVGAVFADYVGCGFLRQDRAAAIGTRV